MPTVDVKDALRTHYVSGAGRFLSSTHRTAKLMKEDSTKVMKYGWQHLHQAEHQKTSCLELPQDSRKNNTTIPRAHVVTARDTADNKEDDIAGDFMVFWMIQSVDRDDFLLCAGDKLIKEMKLNEKNPEREFLLGDGDEK